MTKKKKESNKKKSKVIFIVWCWVLKQENKQQADKREKPSCSEMTKFQIVLGSSPTWMRSKEFHGSSFKQSSFSAGHCSCLCGKLIIVLFTFLWHSVDWVHLTANYANFPLKTKESSAISLSEARISVQCILNLHKTCGRYQLYWMGRCFRRAMYLSFLQFCPVLTRQFVHVSTVLWVGVGFFSFLLSDHSLEAPVYLTCHLSRLRLFLNSDPQY